MYIAFVHYINGRYTKLNEYTAKGETIKEAVYSATQLAIKSREVFPFDEVKIYVINLKDGTTQTIKQ